ncbi:MAG: hypothetical protein HKN90_05080 [Flavobacteriaceae bacterium]|nr:hypothetical protein [Flavobacteriaceae bacterium]
MKKLIVLPIFILMMSFSQCDKNSFDKKSPVEFKKMYFQDWVGGQPGASGTLVTLIGQKPTAQIDFDSIYFNKNVAKVKMQKNDDELTLTANFIKINPKDRDLILSGDPKEEFGNKPPKNVPKIPFELADNEAVVSYFLKGTKRYFRVKNIAKKKTLYYP